MIFVNIAVRDLPATMEFFGKLGFEYNRKFCDENAACMIINDLAYVMLLHESFFRTFTDRAICDTKTHTEGLFAISCSSREEVDALVRKALEAGGSRAQDPVDHGFMYAWSFYDLDGHHWEVLWMAPAAAAA
jgi:predicted lactoylglutathione lyase